MDNWILTQAQDLSHHGENSKVNWNASCHAFAYSIQVWNGDNVVEKGFVDLLAYSVEDWDSLGRNEGIGIETGFQIYDKMEYQSQYNGFNWEGATLEGKYGSIIQY